MWHARSLQKLAVLALSTASASAFITPTFSSSRMTKLSSTKLSMGLLDSISSFLQDREGDFERLEDSESAFGPGPLLLLYNAPGGIADDELMDMVSDGAPQAFEKGITLAHISANDEALLDTSLSDALEQVVRDKGAAGIKSFNKDATPVLFFSGFGNDEMLETYNIVGREIYDESGGSLSPACAKAVPNAMNKPLRQVLDEISGDHQDAMSAD